MASVIPFLGIANIAERYLPLVHQTKRVGQARFKVVGFVPLIAGHVAKQGERKCARWIHINTHAAAAAG